MQGITILSDAEFEVFNKSYNNLATSKDRNKDIGNYFN